MANAASGKVRTPAVEITRSNALSEILAESWWLVGFARNSWHYLWPDLPLKSHACGAGVCHSVRRIHAG